ncbi:hypothetical protein IMC64_003552 [Escherichia coli]|nr:hypothetical protein [Escherichia coli]EGL8746316.1 hypothetical protein [Escherichia coli]
MRSLNFSRLRGVRGVKRTRERRCDQLKSTQHFIPQSLQRGGLVMTTGGHPPPEAEAVKALGFLKQKATEQKVAT